MSELHLN